MMPDRNSFKNNPRDYALALVEEGRVKLIDLAVAALKYMSEADVQAMLIANELGPEVDWRFMSNNADRQRFNPREAAIVEAWKRYMTGIGSGTPDHKLAQILSMKGEEPTPRDWIVATTLIQWLATNVGQCILFETGYQLKPKEE